MRRRAAPGVRAARWAIRNGRWLRPTTAVLVVAVLTVAVFWDYLRGTSAPQWDFYSHYTTEGWAWWRDGSLLHQPQWMPYAWGGYPALLDVQNGSWYLPTGIAIAIGGPYTVQMAATVSMFTVGFGALGVYALLRSWRVRFVPALFGLVVWFFSAGFTANAEHPDISRAYAWLPWIFLVIGAAWRWDRWWNWPVAGLVLWQGLLAIYPGILVALVYVGAAYVVTTQVVLRPRLRAYLLPLVVTGVGAALMTLLRYLPFYLVRGGGSPSGADTSTFSPDLFGTFLFPYGSDALPNDISMRSFFLPAAVFVLVPFAAWTARRVRPVAVATAVAVVFCFPFWPWHDLLRHLPGMSLSRFTMSDYKPFLLLGLTVLAVSGLQRLLRSDGAAARGTVVRWGAVGVVVALAVVLATSPDFPREGVLPQLAFLFLAAAVLGLLVAARAVRVALAAMLVVLAAGSGATGAWSTLPTWQTDRLTLEVANYGSTVSSLVAEGEREAALPAPVRRPARAVPDAPVAESTDADAARWNTSFYTEQPAVLGYVNLKGTPTFERIEDALFDGSTAARSEALDFWGAPGMLVRAGDGTPAPAVIAGCSTGTSCGTGLAVAPTEYGTGDLRYRVQAASATRVLANEAWYPGWTVRACSTAGDACRTIPTRTSALGAVSFTVPAGHWDVALQYRMPGVHASYVAFLAGVLLIGGGMVTTGVLAVRRRRSRSVEDQRADTAFSDRG
jgi:hypothetical protein